MARMRWIHVAIIALLIAFASSAQALRRVYVANINANTVAVVDAERRALIGVIPVGQQPDGVAVSPDGAYVYVTNFGDDSVSVIETASDSVIDTIAVGSGPVGIAVSPDGREMFVANKRDDSLSVVDTHRRAEVAVVSIRPDTGVNAVAVTPDGKYALVTASFGEKIRLVDTDARKVLDSVRVGIEPNRIAVSPDGQRAYVTMFRDSEDSGLVAIDLRSLEIVARASVRRPTGLAVAEDGDVVYVSGESGVRAFDTESLAPIGEGCVAGGGQGVLALGEPNTVLVVSLKADQVSFLPERLGAQCDEAPPPHLSVIGGPFAIAAMPSTELLPSVSRIESPGFDAKVDVRDPLPVVITAAAGTQELAFWTLRLRSLDGPSTERELAAGSAPVSGKVATLAPAELLPGGRYLLELEVESNGGAVTRSRTRISVPDRRYTVVPLDAFRSDQPGRYEMDASGLQFLRWETNGLLQAYDVSTGLREVLRLRQPLDYLDLLVMSRDGGRIAIRGTFVNGFPVFGVLDLENLAATLLPYSPRHFDLDAEGRWVAANHFGFPEERYAIFDSATGDRLFPPDFELLRPAIKCKPESGGQMRISADGDIVAFVTGIDFGFFAAEGCTLFAYDRVEDSLRVVTTFGTDSVSLPSLDDDGATFGLVLSTEVDGLVEPQPRAILVDIETGETTDVLDGRTSASTDAALSGDGRMVAVSSCEDLDPLVGNADANNELFLLDRSTGRISQVTDTLGGTTACQRAGGPSYDPMVSADGTTLAFAMQGPAAAGPHRSIRNGFAFGAVRAVPYIADNTPPKLELIGETTAEVGGSLNLLVRSGDRDFDSISFFAQIGDSGLPRNATLAADRNDPQAIFRWYPVEPGQVGEHLLRVGTFDGRGGENIQSFVLTICRRVLVDATDHESLISALFGSYPPACGDADVNGDGVISAADIVAAN